MKTMIRALLVLVPTLSLWSCSDKPPLTPQEPPEDAQILVAADGSIGVGSDSGALDAEAAAVGGLRAVGFVTMMGAVGPSGGDPKPFSQTIDLARKASFGSGRVDCEEVRLEFVRRKEETLSLGLNACGPTETLSLNFEVPLRNGEFPAEGGAFPMARAQLYEARGEDHYVSAGSASYGSSAVSAGSTLKIEALTRSATLLGMKIALEAKLPMNPACSVCASGASELTLKLRLQIFDIPIRR
jgi:hypothetical protein